ncbi:MAG TPA: T9SS type A sorting domain-containing protein, partial [Candidatus Kapabacteria bacterium]|nr:T9SS type A sorting domain-containing protein [Candidatus Kapabacteria bacterium]
YDDGQLEMLRNKMWNDLKTSGEEKDLAKIEVNGLKAMKSMTNRSMFKSLGSAAWQQVTSGNQDGHNTGRVRDVAADPNNEKKVYVATASGGVWRTDDISQTPPNWVDLSSRMPSLRTTAIAVDPQDGGIIFCGTGESEGDGFPYNSQQVGVGILRSRDGGDNWEIVDNGLAGKAVSQIIIDATNHQRIYAATTGGLLKSEDGGDTWKKLNDASNSLPGGNILSISYSAQAPNRLYAASTGKIMYSSDYGAHWTQAKAADGLPSGMSRITIACSPNPTSPNVVYASIGTSGTSAAPNCFLGVWSSNDSGVTWTKKMQYNPSAPASSTNRNPLGMQQWWCNALAASPTSPTQILIGGLDIYYSGDGGTKLDSKTQGNLESRSDYAHVDIHRLVFIGKTLYSCADGGLASTTISSSFSQWRTDINVGISALQFVGADADRDFNFAMGGCQDNNTNKAYINSSTQFHNTKGGDGGKCLVAWDDSNIVYTTYIGSTLYKSLHAGDENTFGGNLIEGNTSLYRDPISGGGSGEGITDAYAAYEISSDGATIAYGGRTHVWVSFTGGSDNLSLPSDKGISARFNGIAMSPDGTHIWAGSATSIFRTTDGQNWTPTALDKPSGTLAGVTVDPTNNNNVYVVAGGTGGTGKFHFFKSVDGGVTFTHPTSNFPDINCLSIAVKPENGYIFVGTDKGVIYSIDGGTTWDPLMNNFPAALVTSLKIKGTDHNKLLAGTYGRGVHWLDLTTLGVTNPPKNQSGLVFDAVAPNPIKDGSATLSFTLPQSGQSQITLYDVLGREIKILDKDYYQAGTHSVRFNATGLASGTYVATLVYGGKAISQKIIIE